MILFFVSIYYRAFDIADLKSQQEKTKIKARRTHYFPHNFFAHLISGKPQLQINKSWLALQWI